MRLRTPSTERPLHARAAPHRLPVRVSAILLNERTRPQGIGRPSTPGIRNSTGSDRGGDNGILTFRQAGDDARPRRLTDAGCCGEAAPPISTEAPMRHPETCETELVASERAVLAACASGLIITEVAEMLGQPAEDVRRSVASAIVKLGARSKLEAVVIALRRGLIALLV